MRIGVGSKPSPALIVATIALVAALAGSAVALPGKNTIDKNDLKKGSVTSKALKAGAVGSAAIADGQVGAADIAPGVIPKVDVTIADGSITTAKLADGAVSAAKIAAGGVSSAAIAAGAVDSAAIADGAVDSAAIADGAVGAAAIAGDAVDSASIADGTVGASDLTRSEAPRLVGAPGEPAFGNGGDGDCVWESAAAAIPGLGPVSFYKDQMGIVHLNGLVQKLDGPGGDGDCAGGAPGESADGVIFLLPAGYLPANGQLQGNGDTSSVLIAGAAGLIEGTVTVPGGAVFFNQPGQDVANLDGITFRAASPGARSSSQPVDLDALRDLLR